MTFTGLPAEAFEFYADLAANNTRDWWQLNRDRYERDVRAPLEELLGQLEPEFGPGHLYRPYRDMRFSKDKSPLKDHQGLFVAAGDGVGYYLQVSATGLMVASGWYSPQAGQLARFREAIDAGQADQLRTLVDTLIGQGWQVEGRPLKTRPRGVPADHPDLDLLRWRSLTVAQTHAPEAWMGAPEAADEVRAAWAQCRDLVEWLVAHVGPVDPPVGS